MSSGPGRGPVGVLVSLVVSAVVTAAALVSTMVLYLQPWASCPGVDDSSAGCPVDGPQVVVQQIVALVLVVGALGVALSALVLAGYRSGRR